jgi:flagellar L-ring protein FlgH
MLRLSLTALALAAGCTRIEEIGQAPDLSQAYATPEHLAMLDPGLPVSLPPPAMPQSIAPASLWTGDRGSLLGDRRAVARGDILTVVIEIDDSAQITNQTDRQRSGEEELGIQALFGLEGDSTNLDPAVALGSTSTFSGDGSVRRNEQLELRIAATVVDMLPNGVLAIQGSQEVRVNNELRELLVSGYVRAEDITRQNEITYDKIASARISYGGRGLITDMQQPRYGQQALDLMLPF